GSGKSVATEFFCENGWEKIYFGGLTMDVLAERGLPKNEANERAVRESLRAEHGPGAFAKLLLPRIEETAKRSNTVLDGLYSWSEYKELKAHFGDALTVLAVVTPRLLRYERLAVRTVRPLSFEDSQKRDFAEIENIEKGGPIAIADVYADNSGDVEALREQLKKLL
ncbi:MAG: dephospho-CoA kinase, partial [Clostridia bacterium]|nr:dephospho-CoA kinase [Clostridia bacterium]